MRDYGRVDTPSPRKRKKTTRKHRPKPEQPTLDAKDAVKRAVAYVVDIYKDTAGTAVDDVMLEEIEMDESQPVARHGELPSDERP